MIQLKSACLACVGFHVIPAWQRGKGRGERRGGGDKVKDYILYFTTMLLYLTLLNYNA